MAILQEVMSLGILSLRDCDYVVGAVWVWSRGRITHRVSLSLMVAVLGSSMYRPGRYEEFGAIGGVVASDSWDNCSRLGGFVAEFVYGPAITALLIRARGA